MKIENVESIINQIDEKYIQEAGEISMKKSRWMFANQFLKKGAAIAAAVVLCFVISVPVLAAAGVGPAYDILYQCFPAVAKKLQPVNVSCEDNGIKMEVVSANIEKNTADVYISMQDLTGKRIDETIDLFDSYDLNVSSDSIATCSFVNYNEEEHTATFLIHIEQDKSWLRGSRMTFAVSEFLSGKQVFEEPLAKILLENIETNPEVKMNIDVRGTSGELDCTTKALKKNIEKDNAPVDGVTITAAGFVDGKLHLQVYYENIGETDNHGDLYFVNSKGEKLYCEGTIAFWDEEESGSYEEYVFDISPETKLEDYMLYGYFVTSDTLTQGNWQVSFLLEDMK